MTERVHPDQWGIDGAIWFSGRSPCVRRKVGAVVIRNGRVVGGGFNGPSRKLPPRTCEPGPLQCVRIARKIASGTEPHVVCCDHAEANACQFTDRRDAEGATMYCTDSPCRTCAGLIVNAGIVRVVVASTYPDPDGVELLRAAGVAFEVWKPAPAKQNGAPFDEDLSAGHL